MQRLLRWECMREALGFTEGKGPGGSWAHRRSTGLLYRSVELSILFLPSLGRKETEQKISVQFLAEKIVFLAELEVFINLDFFLILWGVYMFFYFY